MDCLRSFHVGQRIAGRRFAETDPADADLIGADAELGVSRGLPIGYRQRTATRLTREQRMEVCAALALNDWGCCWLPLTMAHRGRDG